MDVQPGNDREMEIQSNYDAYTLHTFNERKVHEFI